MQIMKGIQVGQETISCLDGLSPGRCTSGFGNCGAGNCGISAERASAWFGAVAGSLDTESSVTPLLDSWSRMDCAVFIKIPANGMEGS